MHHVATILKLLKKIVKRNGVIFLPCCQIMKPSFVMTLQKMCAKTEGNEICLSFGIENHFFTYTLLNVTNTAVIVTGVNGNEVLLMMTGLRLPQKFLSL